ncbi:MAG: pyridoxamine 5'-phosphate oxidase family protein [Anaerolineae bacterium]|jgi:nitroimidazol reductase NimA-like FMN-containing flavoprotein (pyridoxamine 5'-phosphate oxidase superfamily)
MIDEPVLGHEFGAFEATASQDPATLECIQALIREEPFAVLCTQGGGQPYGSVVAFAFDPDMGSFVFATPVATRKFRLLSECDRVALVVDNRGKYPEDMMRVGAVTVTGQAEQLESGPKFEAGAMLLTSRHPHLARFVQAPSTALFRVRVFRYLYVTRFQEVRQWLPAARG